MSRPSIDALRGELERTRAELVAVRAELDLARDRISMMEMSRFWKLRNLWWSVKQRLGLSISPMSEPPVAPPTADFVRHPGLEPVPFRTGPAPSHPDRVDVVVAGTGSGSARMALDAVVRYCRPPVTVTVVGGDDASRAAAVEQGGAAIATENGGFSRAVRSGHSDWVLVVSAEAHPTGQIIDPLITCLESDSACAAAVPLSPGLAGGVNPGNPALVAAASARLYPKLGVGGGSVFLVRRSAVGKGNLASPRELFESVGAQGVRVADDAWVDLGDEPIVTPSDPVLAGVVARLAALPTREERRVRGLARWEGKRVLFVLPALDRGGGANVVFSEAQALAEFGVEARVFNLNSHRDRFDASYPSPPVPVVYGQTRDLAQIGARYDAVVATANWSVEWLAPLANGGNGPVLGYYVQDFEPFFYPEGSSDHHRAQASYTLFPKLRRFAKTEWNARMVRDQAGAPCAVIGPSFDTDVFRPRLGSLAEKPFRIAAMIRPSTPRRQPRFTLEVLREISRRHGDAVDICLFGVDESDKLLASLPLDFPHRFLGVLHERSLAALLTQVHVFADFSTYQAMGLTALEAMGAGATAIVPSEGGASSFARHRENALLVDTSNASDCLEALECLVSDPELRDRLAARSLVDVAALAPEKAAYTMLEVLFGAD